MAQRGHGLVGDRVHYPSMRYVIERYPGKSPAWNLLIVIAYRADRETGECFASRRRLAAEARVSTATVHRVLGKLIDVGELGISLSGSGRRSTSYYIPAAVVAHSGEPLAVGVAAQHGEPLAVGVVAHFADRSGSPDGGVVAHLGESPNRGKGKTEGFEGGAGAAPPDGGAPRSTPEPGGAADDGGTNAGVSPEVAAELARFRAESKAKILQERQADQERQRELLGPLQPEPRP